MYGYARRRGPTVAGCGMMLLLIAIVTLLAVGWWRNWYDVASRNAPDEVEFGVRIHKEEVERDLGRVRDETQRLTESAQVASELQTVEGNVTALSASELTVRVGELEHRMMLDEVTQFYVNNDEANLQSVRVGDQVRVTYQESGGQKRASRITSLREENRR
jgi:predicted lysophospholipase L1 biosynthesis ABC-type transport system permease subunit